MLSGATQRVIAYLTLMYQVESPGEIEVWEPLRGRATRHRDAVRLPNCTTCGAAAHPLTLTLPGGHRDNMAVLFHQASAIMPWHLGQPALMRQHLNPRVVHTVRTAFTEHPEATLTPLCEFEALTRAVVGNALRDRVPESAECDLKRLASVLHFSAGGVVVSAGDGEHHIKRYTASGGNLGSAEVYVVVRSVAGVSAGIYHYLLIGDTLERLGELTEADWKAWLGSSQFQVDPDAVIVVVSDVEREFSKYSNRGYLYCLLDAGLMAHRLSFLAGQVGLEAEVLTDFDDTDVQRLLNLAAPASVPACLVALHGSR
jgi:SagB-type dehydrogenase family enzyme